MLLKMQLMHNGWFNKERLEMKQTIILKMHLMLNVTFLPGFTSTMDIPIIQVEWIDNGNSLIRRYSPLMIS